MGFWSVVIPKATINLVTNPSVELDATGYTAEGSGSIARDPFGRRGMYGIKATPTAGLFDGVFYANVALVSGTTYVFSVDFVGINGVPYALWIATSGGTVKATTAFTGNGLWQRPSMSWQADASANFRLYVVKNNHASTGVFYTDGWQMEATQETTYCDGDQEGCTWAGAKHASTSSRPATTRAGGQIVDLDNFGIYVQSAVGIGMSRAEHKSASQAFIEGAEYLGKKVDPRLIQLNASVIGSSWTNLHLLLKNSIDVIKPDASLEDDPIWLIYSGANSSKPAWIRAVYDGGLEFNQSAGFTQDVSLRFIAYDPSWYEDRDIGYQLTGSSSVTNANYIIAKIGGAWQALGTGMNDYVRNIIRGNDGAIYACGNFTTAGGTTVGQIAKWNGASWSALGSGTTNSNINAMVVAPNGDIYAGGAFTTIMGVAANRVAKWNGSSWSALGTGLDGACTDVIIGLDGTLYACGLFSNAGGISAPGIAKWNGSSWSAMGTGLSGVNGQALAIDQKGNVYVGGFFTTAGGVSAASVAKWNGSAFSALGAGLNDTCYSLFVDDAGNLYAGGAFTSPGNRIAKWNGSSWSALGSGLDNLCHSIQIDPDSKLLYVTGTFTTAGGVAIADRVAVWNGYTWSQVDIDLPGTPNTYAILVSQKETYIGYDTSGTAVTSFTNTLTNPGTHSAYPIIHIRRSGGTSATLQWIKNETTGKTLWFNYALLDGEEIIIDLRPNKRGITSSYFGKVLRAILRNSDFASWCLLPGSNLITVVVATAGSPTMTQYMLNKQEHWSVDGVTG